MPVKLSLLPLTFFILVITGFAQTTIEDRFLPAIEDNSMFIEEAYNQEERIVQHISNLVFLPDLQENFYYAFTQEWPAFGLHHQVSYTLQYLSLNRGEAVGLGDIWLHYRYQLSYTPDFVTCAPRLSLIIPAGDKGSGLGYGSWGLQANIPVSKRWSNRFINHLNIGATYFFKIREEDINFNRSIIGYFAGISSIWLISGKFNLMLECLVNLDADPVRNNKIDYSANAIIAPAFRYAIDIRKLQIVPGISVPLTFRQNSSIEAGGLIYLSFEHEF